MRLAVLVAERADDMAVVVAQGRICLCLASPRFSSTGMDFDHLRCAKGRTAGFPKPLLEGTN